MMLFSRRSSSVSKDIAANSHPFVSLSPNDPVDVPVFKVKTCSLSTEVYRLRTGMCGRPHETMLLHSSKIPKGEHPYMTEIDFDIAKQTIYSVLTGNTRTLLTVFGFKVDLHEHNMLVTFEYILERKIVTVPLAYYTPDNIFIYINQSWDEKEDADIKKVLSVIYLEKDPFTPKHEKTTGVLVPFYERILNMLVSIPPVSSRSKRQLFEHKLADFRFVPTDKHGGVCRLILGGSRPANSELFNLEGMLNNSSVVWIVSRVISKSMSLDVISTITSSGSASNISDRDKSPTVLITPPTPSSESPHSTQ